MLECLDFESRKLILSLIYDSYVKERSKHVTYGLLTQGQVAEWENYRFKWIAENILDKISECKKDASSASTKKKKS